jgi:hypothetical protein
MWKKSKDTCKDSETPVCIAGYSGSSDPASVFKNTGDVEFSAAVSASGSSAITYLLWKMQTSETVPNEAASAGNCDKGSLDESQAELGSDLDVSDSETNAQDTGENLCSSSYKVEPDSDAESVAKTTRKRPRVYSLDDDEDDDFLDCK